MNKRPFCILFLLCLVFLGLRILMLSSNITFFYSHDENLRAKLAVDIFIFHKPFPSIKNIFSYQIDNPFEQSSSFRGGALIVALLYLPFAWLLGINTFSLKLVALIFSLGNLIVWYIFLYRFFGTKTAVFFGIFYLIGLPIPNTFSLITVGDYIEASFFVSLGFLLLFVILVSQAKKKTSFLFFILGLICGFSFYFDYSCLLFIFVSFFVLWILGGKKFYKIKYFLGYVLGFSIGFSPWILPRLWGYFRFDFTIHGSSFLHIFSFQNLSNFLDNLKHVLLNLPILPPSYENDYIFSRFPFIVRIIVFLLYKIIFLGGIVHLIFFEIRKTKIKLPIVGIVLYVICFFLILSIVISPFRQPRHFVPLYPFIFVLMAIFLNSSIFRVPRIKYLKIGLFIFLLLMNFLDNLNIVSFKCVKNPLEFRGFEYGYFLKCPYVSDRIIKFLDRYVEFRYRCFGSLAPLMEDFFSAEYQIKYNISQSDLHWREKMEKVIKDNICDILARLARKEKDMVTLGWALGIIYDWNIGKIVSILERTKALNSDKIYQIYYGLGLGIGSLEEKNQKRCFNKLQGVRKNFKQIILRGVKDFEKCGELKAMIFGGRR